MLSFGGMGELMLGWLRAWMLYITIMEISYLLVEVFFVVERTWEDLHLPEARLLTRNTRWLGPLYRCVNCPKNALREDIYCSAKCANLVRFGQRDQDCAYFG